MSPGKTIRRPARRRALLLLAVLLVASARSSRAEATPRPADGRSTAPASESLRRAEERFGVAITSVRTSAGGHIVDLRYRVLDAGKASVLFVRGLRPQLYDAASGRMLSVPSAPKTGPLRSSGRLTAGRTYFALFSNPGRTVRCGSRVTLLFGDLEVDGLVVE